MQQHVVVCQQQPLGVIPSRAFLFSVFTACRSSSENREREIHCAFTLQNFDARIPKRRGRNIAASPKEFILKSTLWVSKTTQKLASENELRTIESWKYFGFAGKKLVKMRRLCALHGVDFTRKLAGNLNCT